MTDTIAAIATPPGQGGIGVIRISGPKVPDIAYQVLKKLPKPRYTCLTPFYDGLGQVLDEGLAIYFEAPHSFTGEAVLELQGHGGPIVLDLVLAAVLQAGARLARPGEFSERAFLNNKLDLVQVEAISDLISASSEEAARSAVKSLQGVFSAKINELTEALIYLRTFIEATLDFPEEDVAFVQQAQVILQLEAILKTFDVALAAAKQGVLLREGLKVVIAGHPNVGKSSLLNALSGNEVAIVSAIAGTTRDVIKENIHLAGIPLHVYDTAGLRDSSDVIEQEGVRRAKAALADADVVLWVKDSTQKEPSDLLPTQAPVFIIHNKTDLLVQVPPNSATEFYLSAKTGAGLEAFKATLLTTIGYNRHSEGNFMARRRHLDALTRARDELQLGLAHYHHHQALELLAEHCRLAQEALGEITGKFYPDDLLGKIFSTFCIGK